MEINPNRNVDPVIPAAGPAKARATAPTQANGTSFDQSAGLDSALAATPDSRPEVVSRAESLVASSNYPPPEMINRIANLLAANLLAQDS
jgi:hypothetical protein